MRSSIALAILLLASTASAESTSSGGSGRLGQVSGGIGRATGGGQSGGGSTQPRDDRYGGWTYDGLYHRHTDTRGYTTIVDFDGNIVRTIPPPPIKDPHREGAGFTIFLGVQKVIESDTSASAAVAISDDWFRIAGTLQRYWEERMDDQGKLTMTMASLTLGIPVQQGGRSRAFLEGGVQYLTTANDPMVDSSLTGGKFGLHLEQGLRSTTIIGDVHGLVFDGVKAVQARVGLRYRNFEAAFRALDFDVGPALYGPELGVSF